MGFAADIQNDAQGWADSFNGIQVGGLSNSNDDDATNGWIIQQGDEQIKPLEVGIVNVRMLNGFAITDTDKEGFIASEFWFSLDSNRALLAAAKQAITQFQEDDKAAGLMINPVRHLVAIKGDAVFHLILTRYNTVLIKGDKEAFTRISYNVSSPEAEILAALKAFTTNLLGW